MSQELQTPEPPVQPAQRPRRTRPPGPARPHKSSADLIHDAEDDGFVVRHKTKLIVAGVIAVAVGLYFLPKTGPSAPPRKAERIVQVQLPPPPPPPKVQPPPPPKVQPPPDKMEKQAPVADDKPKEAAPKKADNPPPTALATGIKGDGPGMGLASSGNGIGGGNTIGGKTGDGGGGGKWDRYAGQVQMKIADALRKHDRTKAASIGGLEVRIWPDATGRITRAKLAGTTGNAAVDAAIQNEILSGLQLAEAPPAGMKLPILLRLSAKRP